MKILTRITDQKILFVDIHAYQKIKNQGPGPYKSLHHTDNRKYFSGLTPTKVIKNGAVAKVRILVEPGIL